MAEDEAVEAQGDSSPHRQLDGIMPEEEEGAEAEEEMVNNNHLQNSNSLKINKHGLKINKLTTSQETTTVPIKALRTLHHLIVMAGTYQSML